MSRPQVLDDFHAVINKFPLLSKEEEKEIGNRVQSAHVSSRLFFEGKISLEEYENTQQDALEARSLMVHSNLAFVIKRAIGFARFSTSILLEDFVNEGMLGLIAAAEKYDPKHGTRFITYADHVITDYLVRLKYRHNNVCTPPYMFAAIHHIEMADEKLKEMGYETSEKNVSNITGFALRKIKTIRKAIETLAIPQLTHQQEDRTHEYVPIVNCLADPKSTDDLEREQNKEAINYALTKIPNREAMVMRLRLGQGDSAPMTLEEIGQMLDCSKERIRQIEAIAKDNIMRILQEQYNVE